MDIGKFGYQLGIEVVHEVCNINPDFGKTLFLWPLVRLLRDFCQIDVDFKDISQGNEGMLYNYNYFYYFYLFIYLKYYL